MFRSFFHKSEAGHKGKSLEAPLVPASANPAATEAQTVAQAKPVVVDEAMLVIGRELSGLAQLPVAQAARERGWAALQRELERRPVVATGTRSTVAARSARPAKARSWRWAVASAAAAVAVIATLIGTYSGGLLQTAGNDDPIGTVTSVTSVVSSDTTEPSTTVTTEGTTVSTVGPGTTQAPNTTVIQPSTTQSPSTSGTQPTTPTTSRPTRTTGGGSTTTQPGTTSTTDQQLYTSAQREGSARTAVAYLADLVITGNTSGARDLVAPEAQASLAQMVMTLSDPNGYRITGVQSLSDTIVRVTLQISDRVAGPNGELNEVYSKFAIKVRVDEKGAVITAINAG